MKKLLSDKQDAYLRKIAPGRSTKECVDALNKRFNAHFTRSQIQNYKNNHRILSGKNCWEFVDYEKHRKYPEEVRNFIFENYKGTGHKKMSELIKEKFDYDMTPKQVDSFYGNNHLNSGITGWFEKGIVPKNKGKRLVDYMSPEMIERSKPTRFKPGQMPHNTVPVGTVKELKDGYLWVKINNQLKPKSKRVNWKPLHHIMYEFYNGTVPEGHDVMFLDGNVKNFSKDNLEVITKAERLYLNRHNFISSDPTITRSGLVLARMMNKTYKRKNQNGK